MEAVLEALKAADPLAEALCVPPELARETPARQGDFGDLDFRALLETVGSGEVPLGRKDPGKEWLPAVFEMLLAKVISDAAELKVFAELVPPVIIPLVRD